MGSAWPPPQACGVDYEVKAFCAENLEEKIHKRCAGCWWEKGGRTGGGSPKRSNELHCGKGLEGCQVMVSFLEEVARASPLLHPYLYLTSADGSF